MIRDNENTSPDIAVARYRAKDRQATLNIELELTSRTTGNTDPNAGGSSMGGALGGTVIGDIAQGVRDPNPGGPISPIIVDNPL